MDPTSGRIRAASGVVRSDAPAMGVVSITMREREILRLLSQGKSHPEIAAELFRSPKTIDKHCARLYHKLGVQSQAQLTALVKSQGVDGVLSQAEQTAAAYPKLNDRVAHAALAIERNVLSFDHAQFFRQFVIGLRDELGLEMAAISEYDHIDKEIVALVGVDGDSAIDQLVCYMDTSACGKSFAEGQYTCDRNAMTAFPKSSIIQDAKIEAYAGIRLETEATGPIGCMWVASREPFKDAAFVSDVLRVVRPRVSSELALQIAVDRLEDSGESLESVRPLPFEVA